MGLCCSKVEPPQRPSPRAEPIVKLEKKVAAEDVATEKKQVFVIAQTAKKAAAASGCSVETVKRKDDTLAKKVKKEAEASVSGGSSGGGGAASAVVPVVEDFKPAPVRTSSCTKEELDAILIQCGRLSRSSSGNDTGMGHRRMCSGSKRSYDFDNEKKGDEEEEWVERPVSRPSPRRRTPGRDRSGSMERRGSGEGGGRRASRSPGKRSEVPASSGSTGERSRQPVKMVSVPAREKTRGTSPSAAAAAHKRRSDIGGPLRSGSPRSRSPANTSRATMTKDNASSHHNPVTNQPQSLSRSSSRKAEQSPYRRNPMAEIDENVLRGGHQSSSHDSKMQKTREGADGSKKVTPPETEKASENVAPITKSTPRTGGASSVHTSIMKANAVSTDCRMMEQQQIKPEIVEEAIEKGSMNCTEIVNAAKEEANTRAGSRTKHSRRPSRDLDHALDLNPDNSVNPTSYASTLLEDIHSYRHQHQNAAFSLPACLSKVCSIIDAVADLNSTSSENKSSEADRSKDDSGIPSETNVRRVLAVRKDSNLLELGLHKYVTVRGSEMEPQESAGSNSFVGQPWASPWEPNSADSNDCYWTSNSINGDEVEQEASVESEACARTTSKGVSGGNSFMAPTSSSKRRELCHQRASSGVSGGSEKTGGTRTLSLAAQ